MNTTTMLDTTTTPVTTADPVSAPVLAPPMTLSDAINAAHQRVCEAGRSTLLFAKEAGEHLLAAKAECAHGEFKAWVEKNCAFPYRTARRYMQLSKMVVDDRFDMDATIDSVLDTNACRRNAPTPTSAEATESTKEKPTMSLRTQGTAKVSELKAEIGRLANELKLARDALATAEAHIADLKAGEVPVVPVDLQTKDTTEELATLRRDVVELNEMLDTAVADRKALEKEVTDMKRQLRKAAEASPVADAALKRSRGNGGDNAGETFIPGVTRDADGHVMQNEWDF